MLAQAGFCLVDRDRDQVSKLHHQGESGVTFGFELFYTA